MANQSCNNFSNSNTCSSISTTIAPDSPWRKLSEPLNIQPAFPVDSVMDSSSWPALSSQRVTSHEMILPESSSLAAASTIVETYSGGSVSTEIAGGNDVANESSETIDSVVSVSDGSAPGSEQNTMIPLSSSSISSTPSSRGNHSRQYSSGHNQNHQHYPSGRLGSNQRGNGFNSKGGNRGGDGYPNQNFQNRRRQNRGFNNWNHNRGGFNANAHARLVNSQQQNHHGFGNGPSGFIAPPPPLTHSFPHSTPMVNPPYVNVNVNHPPPPPPAPLSGYVLPFGYYGNPYFSEASNPLYYPPLPSIPPLPSPPPPNVDAMGGAPTYNQPILPNPEVGLCNTILHQIEYYFSKENLVKDAYLKSLMDDEGWVPVHVIAGFRRVNAITNDTSLIVRALQPSAVVEVQGDKMRKRGDWMNWVRHGSPAARVNSVPDISTGIQNIQLGENAGVDALVGDDLNCLHAQTKGSDGS
ncbi:hypothetical protein NE237_027012 [Protea cynaroides]|uniref:HTH La-type RNA-binding domain-containing protein n=1 Tax=Protea cynaroides TaxID=273540 RepID=A0A9Q0JTT5_9MAGN|nr:hypothetical protein NE237_027012 [Protea cynaroides]